MRTYNFHTNAQGIRQWVKIEAASLAEALWFLRLSLYDGETIEGWQ